jgi:hypothetical protein
MDSPKSVISKDFFGHAAKVFLGVINRLVVVAKTAAVKNDFFKKISSIHR